MLCGLMVIVDCGFAVVGCGLVVCGLAGGVWGSTVDVSCVQVVAGSLGVVVNGLVNDCSGAVVEGCV